MTALELFASVRHPLRCSRLPGFMLCNWKTAMEYLQLEHREGGSAAQTGTACHLAVKEYHQKGKEVKKALAIMRATRDEYPMANLPEAEELFRGYARDPRNSEAQVVYSERLLAGEIAPGIFLEGTCDQIRENPQTGEWEIWDVKTSRFDGVRIRDDHTYQIAAYAVLASQQFNRVVHPGAILMVRAYTKAAGESPAKAIVPYEIRYDDAVRLVAMVADRVREVRAGHVAAGPGDHCRWCCGVPECMTRFAAFKGEFQNV